MYMRILGLVVVLGLAPAVGWAAAPQLETLLGHVPPDANVVVAMDIGAMLESPLAGRKGWQKGMAFAFAEGAARVPPNCLSYLQAAQIRLGDERALWEVAAAELSLPVTRERWRKMVKGDSETIGEFEVAAPSRDSYCAVLGFTRLVARSPADRQQFLRWLRRGKTGQPPVYLRDAVVAGQTAKASMVVAIDLIDVVTPAMAKEALQKIDELKVPEPQLDELSETLASLRGLRLEVSFVFDAQARLLIDFGQDPHPLRAVPQIRERLAARFGLGEDELSGWSLDFEPKCIRMTGTLTDSQIRRLSMLIETRPIVVDDDWTERLEKLPMEEATRQQFRLIATMIGDLRLRVRSSKKSDQAVLWLERYARQIESLPVGNVDQELMSYRSDVVARLERIADDVRFGPYSATKRTVDRVTVDKATGARGSQAIEEEDAPCFAEARAIMGQTVRMRARFKEAYKGEW